MCSTDLHVHMVLMQLHKGNGSIRVYRVDDVPSCVHLNVSETLILSPALAKICCTLHGKL